MSEKTTETRVIKVEDLEPNTWNTNEMNEVEFGRLVAEIKDVGFLDYPQVVQLDSGKYQIVGGEHRYKAAKILGYESIPCVVITDEKFKDEDLRKFVSLRLNIIKGKINPEKFVVLYEEMSKKYGVDSLKDLMGFCDGAAWNKLTRGIRESLKDSGVESSTIEKFDESMKEVKTIDGLSTVLNKIFNEHGDTLQNNFIAFNFGSKDGIFIMCEDESVYDAVEELVKVAQKKNISADAAIGKFVKNWKDAGIDDLEPNVVKETKKAGADY